MIGQTTLQAAQKGPSRADSLRALSILERLASVEDQAADGALVLQLSDALLPILAISANAGRKRTRGDEAATLRVLGVLAAIWSKAAQGSMSGELLCELTVSAQIQNAGGWGDIESAMTPLYCMSIKRCILCTSTNNALLAWQPSQTVLDCIAGCG